MVAKCLSSGAAEYWVRPLRASEARVLWTRLWRQQVRDPTGVGLPAWLGTADGSAASRATGEACARLGAAADVAVPTRSTPVLASSRCTTHPAPTHAAMQESPKGPAAGDDTGSGSGNSTDAAAT